MQVAQMQVRFLSRSALPRACSALRSSRGRLAYCGVSHGQLSTPGVVPCGSLMEARRGASSSSDAAPSSSDEDESKKAAADAANANDAEGAAATEAASAEVLLDPEAAAAARLAARDAIIQEILSRDKVIFELKRQHELSMLRVEQNQSRVLKDQEDRGMYYEQNSNVHTFDTISVGLYSQRSTLYHAMSAERLRNVKIFLMVFTTLMTCVYFYYRYIINPDWAYVEKPMTMIGSRVQSVREQRWKTLSTEERFEEMRQKEKAYSAQNE